MKKNQLNIFSYKKNKNKQKNILTCLQNEQGTFLKTNSRILNECKNYFQTLYTKQKTCETSQNKLLQNIKRKVTDSQNSILKNEIQISEIKKQFIAWKTINHPEQTYYQ